VDKQPELDPIGSNSIPELLEGEPLMIKMVKVGIVGLSFAGMLALSVGSNARADAAKTCTNESLEGSYGFTLNGVRIGGPDPGPRAAVGRFTADGKGNYAGTQTRSKVGVIIPGSFIASYNVLADCTGSVTVTRNDGTVRHYDFVIVSEKEVIAIQTDDGRVTTSKAEKLDAK
jgi:hypothetical protein